MDDWTVEEEAAAAQEQQPILNEEWSEACGCIMVGLVVLLVITIIIVAS